MVSDSLCLFPMVWPHGICCHMDDVNMIQQQKKGKVMKDEQPQSLPHSQKGAGEESADDVSH